MFRNRQLQVEMVKVKKGEDGEVPTEGGPSFQEKVDIVTNSMERVALKVGIGVLAYVLADTIRRVAVEVMKAPPTE